MSTLMNMRILFSSVPQHGHLLPLLPLARAFQDRGHEVAVLTAAGMAPVVAVPTTAGTGSEVGRASVITDVRDHTKKIIFHPRMLPALVSQLNVSLLRLL